MPAQGASSAGTAETCPRCHTDQSWGEASWCPACGYYPAIDSRSADGASWADALPETPVEEEDHRTALESIPGWFWGMIAGVVGITCCSIAVRFNFPDEDSPRGTIALVQLVTGLLSMLVAHLIAGKVAMSSDRRVNVNDILLSWFNVWQPTITDLPRTFKRVWAMVWGMVSVLTAMTIIGGIDYGAPFRGHDAPEIKPMNVIGTVAGAAAAQAKAQGKKDASLGEALGDLQSQVSEAQAGGGMLAGGSGQNMSMQDALNELGDVEGQLDGMSDALNGAANLAMNGGLTREQLENGLVSDMECFIYGVVVNEKNIPTGFLFAANTRGQDQHVAEIDAKDLPKDAFRKIAVRLFKETQKESEIQTTRQAIWVKPVVTCRLKFKGFSENGELLDAKFDAIVVQQRGVVGQHRSMRPASAERLHSETLRR